MSSAMHPPAPAALPEHAAAALESDLATAAHAPADESTHTDRWTSSPLLRSASPLTVARRWPSATPGRVS